MTTTCYKLVRLVGTRPTRRYSLWSRRNRWRLEYKPGEIVTPAYGSLIFAFESVAALVEEIYRGDPGFAFEAWRCETEGTPQTPPKYLPSRKKNYARFWHNKPLFDDNMLHPPWGTILVPDIKLIELVNF